MSPSLTCLDWLSHVVNPLQMFSARILFRNRAADRLKVLSIAAGEAEMGMVFCWQKLLAAKSTTDRPPIA